jgi:hypothetical protein
MDDISLDEFQRLFRSVGRQVKWWHFEVGFLPTLLASS